MSSFNIFLSEFSGTIYERFFTNIKYKAISAIILVAGCLMVLTVGHLGFANALKLEIPFYYQVDNKFLVTNPERANLIFGYAPQLNHAFFYLLIAPVGLYVAFLFIESVDISFRSLLNSNRLKAINQDPLSTISSYNSKSLCPKPWLVGPTIILALMLFLNLGRESLYFIKSTRENSNKIGFTQAIDLDRWITRYNDSNYSDEDRYNMIKNISGITEQIEDNIRDQIHNHPALTSPDSDLFDHWLSEGGVVRSHSSASKIGALKDPQFNIDLLRSIRGGTLSLPPTAKAFGAPRRNSAEERFFYLFAFAAHSYEGAFHAICVWLALKIVWFLVLVRRTLNHSHKGISISVKVDDPARAFGLEALHRPYNLISWLILIASVTAFLVFFTNVSNGTYIKFSSNILDSTGQLLIVALCAVVLGALIYGPIYSFRIPLIGLQNKAISELRQKNEYLIRSALTTGDDKELDTEINLNDQQIKIIEEQSTWPKGSKSFRRCLVVSLILLLSQVGLTPIMKQLGIKELAQYFDIASALRGTIRTVTEQLYNDRLHREVEMIHPVNQISESKN